MWINGNETKLKAALVVETRSNEKFEMATVYVLAEWDCIKSLWWNHFKAVDLNDPGTLCVQNALLTTGLRAKRRNYGPVL